MSVWTDSRVETLRKLWLEGLSASQIADEMKSGITRMAVIGKVHRLGLSGRANAPKPGPEPKPRRTAPKPAAPAPSPLPKVPPMRSFNEHPLEARPDKDDVTDEERAAIAERANAPAPESANITIDELTETTCRWPIGDPRARAFRYCGGEAPLGREPYCRFHRQVAYTPAALRKGLR